MIFDEKINNLIFWEHSSNTQNDELIKILFVSRTKNILDKIISNLSRFAPHFTHQVYFYALDCSSKELSEYIRQGYIIVHLEQDLNGFFDQIQSISQENGPDVKVISNTVDQSFLKAMPDTDFIGFQRHQIGKAVLHTVDTNSLGSCSLGLIKNNHVDLEPIMRTIEYVHFEPSSGRHAEWPGIQNILPTGLSVEEICQIFRYAGSSYQINYLSIDRSLDLEAAPECFVSTAIALWYFLEGIESRTFRNDISLSGFQEFVLSVKDIEESLVFGFSTGDGKWWVRVDQSDRMVPCSKDDYEKASKGLLTDRLFRKLFT